MIEGSTHEEDITIANIYVLTTSKNLHMLRILTDLKEKIKKQYNNTAGLQYPNLTMDRSYR